MRPNLQNLLLHRRPGAQDLLQAEFSAEIAAGGLNNAPAEKGKFVAVDSENKMSVSGGELVIAGGKAVPVEGDPGCWLTHDDGSGVVNSSGQTLVLHLDVGSANQIFYAGFAGTTVNVANRAAFYGVGSGGILRYYSGSTKVFTVGSYAAGGMYFAVSLGGTVCGGAFALAQGGPYPNWTLLRVDRRALGMATGFPAISNYNAVIRSQFIRPKLIPWSPAPAVSDGFSRINFGFGETAPQVGFIGDSQIEGYLAATPVSTYFSPLATVSVLNKGIGGQTTTQIAARFVADCVAYRPAIAVMNGGINDINAGGSKATFLANWTAMLDEAVNAGIKPIVLLIYPNSANNNALMQIADDWNASLTALVASYVTAVTVDMRPLIGEFRAGGDPGNLWDIQAAYIYAPGNEHLNNAGNSLVAQTINSTLLSLYPDSAPGHSDGRGHLQGQNGPVGAGGGGVPWTVRAGAVTMGNGQAMATSLDGDRAIVTCPVPWDNIYALFKAVKVTTGCGVILRFKDLNNYIYCYHDGTNVKIIKRVGGVDQAAVDTKALTYVANANHEFIVDGITVAQYYNDTVVNGLKTINDADLQGNKSMGLIFLDSDSYLTSVVAYPRGNSEIVPDLNILQRLAA